MSSEIKYTDRDVRDNKSQVTELVTDFLEDYTGEFQFLIDCKMRLAQGMDLSVGMMRGVLNCMRADPRIEIELPDPLPPIEHHNVVPIKKSQRRWGPAECDIEEDHDSHYIGDEKEFPRRHFCSGKWAINREAYTMPARVNPDRTAIVAKTGAMIHRLTGEAEVAWYPERHGFGFISGSWSSYKGRYSTGSIFYKTCCKGASIIQNGLLLTDQMAEALVKDRRMLDTYLETLNGNPPPPSQRKQLAMCKRCWQ